MNQYIISEDILRNALLALQHAQVDDDISFGPAYEAARDRIRKARKQLSNLLATPQIIRSKN